VEISKTNKPKTIQTCTMYLTGTSFGSARLPRNMWKIWRNMEECEGNTKAYAKDMKKCEKDKFGNVKRLRDFENFRALPYVWAVGLGKFLSCPPCMSHETWKISELSPIYGSWNLENFPCFSFLWAALSCICAVGLGKISSLLPMYGLWDFENFKLSRTHKPWDFENFRAIPYLWAVKFSKRETWQERERGSVVFFWTHII